MFLLSIQNMDSYSCIYNNYRICFTLYNYILEYYE